MEQAKRDEFRQILQGQLDELLREAGKTVSEMTDEKANFPIRRTGRL
jgi:DnaK suppressor protein